MTYELLMYIHEFRVVDPFSRPEERSKPTSYPRKSESFNVSRGETYTQQCFLHFIASNPAACFSATTSSIRVPIPATHSLRDTIFSSLLKLSVPPFSFFCADQLILIHGLLLNLLDASLQVSELLSQLLHPLTRWKHQHYLRRIHPGSDPLARLVFRISILRSLPSFPLDRFPFRTNRRTIQLHPRRSCSRSRQ